MPFCAGQIVWTEFGTVRRQQCRHFAKRPRWWWTSCQLEYERKLFNSQRCGKGLASWKIRQVTRKNKKHPCLNPQQKSLRSGHVHQKRCKYSWGTSKNSKPSVSLMVRTSRPIYLQCMQKYAKAWQWIFPKILAMTSFRNREKNMNNEEYKFYQKELEEQRRQIWNSFQRIILVILYLATVQLSPSVPNSIIPIALGTRRCM